MEEIVMSVHFDATRAPTVFALPEESHAELVKLCGHLRLMAQLTAAGGNASMPDQRLGPDAMAWCFSRLAKEVESIIEAAWYSAELVNSYGTARKS